MLCFIVRKHKANINAHHASARNAQYNVYRARDGWFLMVSSEKAQRTPLFACTRDFKSNISSSVGLGVE